VNKNEDIVQLSEEIIINALETVPREFNLYNSDGDPAVLYAGDKVHFDPGSSCVHILD
jgi:trimethylamine:corrinoid methyltransferase-like protein